jgi:nitroreductase
MNTDGTQVLRNAIAAAVMAPSSYNTQPWRFRIVGSATLEILADPARQMAVVDRDRRQLVQACGCALYNARVAVRAMGFTDEVTVMLAEEAPRPELLATLHLGRARLPTAADHAAMRALALRHTNRRPFLARPVADVAPLLAAAEREGAWAIRLHPPQKQALGALILEGDRLQYADPAFRAELAHWLNPIGSRRRDGLPFVEKEYGSAMPFGVRRTMRSASLGVRFGQLEEELVDGSPVVLVLGTDADDPPAWLASGQALEAVLLAATGLELEAAFLNQVIEVPHLRAGVAELAGRAGHPQMVLRLGYPSEPLDHAAPRRALDDVLEIVP